MKQRIPLVDSAAARVVAVLSMTEVGDAATTLVRAALAHTAGALRGWAPSTTARVDPGRLWAPDPL